MTAEQRRSRISARLHESHQPISATALARELGVSRQIIVGDVALLRAAGFSYCEAVDSIAGATFLRGRK